MLRISRIADYGVVLGTRLAALEPSALRSATDLAGDTGIPQPTVSKILKVLGRAGLVDSERGAHGGYRLARDADQTSVAEIIAAIEGPIGVTECGIEEDHADCSLSSQCDVRGNWQLINQAILSALEGISLAEMTRPAAPVLVSLGRKRTDGRPEVMEP
ncbi:MAG: SUF system Fe-S cluster assembly regulator [Sandaracinaceae bacterium]